MDSTYGAHPDMTQQMPLGGGPGYTASMPPPGSGSGTGSLHHPPYQHHQQTAPLQHQQPPLHQAYHHIPHHQASAHPLPQHQHQHQQQQQLQHQHQQQQQHLQQQQHQPHAHSHISQYQPHQQPLPHQQAHQHSHTHLHGLQQQQQQQQHQVHPSQSQQQQQQQQTGQPHGPQGQDLRAQQTALPPPPQPPLQPHNLPHPLHLNHHPPQVQQLPPYQLQQRQSQPTIAHKVPPQVPSGLPLRPSELLLANASNALLHSEPQDASSSLLASSSKIDEVAGRRYQLDVVQQPRRARMCGFGDKDRRPITPPPCVRLIITDLATGKEIDCNEIDYSMFVLNVDLWSEDGTREVNLVRSSASSPSITSTSPYAYTNLNGGDAAPMACGQQILPSGRDPTYNAPQSMDFLQQVYQPSQTSYTQSATPSYPPNGTYGPPQQIFPQHGGFSSQASMNPYGRSGLSPYAQEVGALARLAMTSGQPQGMFTRNLIGSLAASAFRLSDTSDRIGIWFVLQDLSVRTEGPFRLRFSFVDVGSPDSIARDGSIVKVNNRRAPIMASCFSDVFNVYSAKKFPGVCESTPLSKIFATQGIKIPIRKDANLKGGDGDDDYND